MAGILIVDQIQNSSNTVLINSGVLAANTVGTAQIGAVTNINSGSATSLTLQTANTTAVTIDASQNVSIGTASTIGKLNVTGTDNLHIYLKQSNIDNGWLLATSSADGYFRLQRRGDGASPTNNERFTVMPEGQMYHNGTYLLGSSYNAYHAKSTSTINVVNTGWTDTTLTWSNVYIPTNTRKVYLWFHLTLRNNGVNLNHTAFRLRVSNGNYVGDGSWGFGISQFITSSSVGHCVCSQFVNILDYDGFGNQASLAAGNTYTFYLQALDANGSGGNLRLAAESNGVHQAYTPQHGTIWVL